MFTPPTKLPGPDVIVAVADPAPIATPAVTVIVSVWFVPTALLADGPMAMAASAHDFDAGPLFTRPLTVVVPSVVRSSPTPLTSAFVLAETVVVPVVFDVITTVHGDPVPAAAAA